MNFIEWLLNAMFGCQHTGRQIDYGGWYRARKFHVKCLDCERILHVGQEFDYGTKLTENGHPTQEDVNRPYMNKLANRALENFYLGFPGLVEGQLSDLARLTGGVDDGARDAREQARRRHGERIGQILKTRVSAEERVEQDL
jgi:hypothetical protein